MKKNVLALSIAAMLGGLGFADQPYYPHNVYYYYPNDISYGKLAMEFMYDVVYV